MSELVPQTDNERYLAALAGWTGELPVPNTRNEQFLKAILDAGGGGGGGGAKTSRVTSLNATPLRTGAEIVDAVGIPVYVKEADLQEYAAYGLTDTGWYVFARIAAPTGVTVGGTTAVTGAAGAIITAGADHVDVAVRFEVAAQTREVTVAWGEASEDTFIFRTVDLAVRNLDYRTTFYVYDLGPFVTWTYALTTDAAFVAGSHYYTEDGGVYTEAEVQTVAYQLTADETFQSGKTYYTKSGDTYTAAEVTVGEAVTPDTYYEQTTVPVPAYYTLADGTYTQATGVFEAGVTYYTKSGNTYAEATVTEGEPIPAYYTHSLLHIEGMARNVTYQLDTPVDCPSEIVLPAIEDDGHGAWFEMRFRHTGSFSSTLLPEDPDVKVATEHTQAETAGMNMVDLHYMNVAGMKVWRFMNTHSTLPAETPAAAE